MSPAAWQAAKLAAVLLVAGLLQAAFADGFRLWGGQPDLLLTTALVGAMFCGEGGSALLGFFASLIHASLAAPPHGGVGAYLVSGTLACFGIGWLEGRVYRDSMVVAAAVVVLGTLAAECLFLLLCPQPSFWRWARTGSITLAWNTVLSVPCHFVIRRLLGAHGAGDQK